MTTIQQSPTDLSPSRDPAADRPTSHRLCVINDDLRVDAPLAILLQDRGFFHVTSCPSADAFRITRDGDHDLFILDVDTANPERGWDILTFLQIHPSLHGIPIIVCSASTDELLAKEVWLREHGITIIEKPFELDALYGHIDAALKREG